MKKVVKRGLEILLGMIIMLIINKTAKADLIWTPNDDFFNQHYEECEKVGRNFLANGEKGYIIIKKNPESTVTVANKENGTDFFVSFTYTDQKDRIWGVVEYDDGTGWIRMKDLAVIYDNISFCEEHKNDFEDYQGEFEDYTPGKEPLQFYEYPGSGTPKSSMDMQKDRLEFTYTYKDPQGKLWGYVGYYFTHRGWICLSDPTNAKLQATETGPQVTIIPPSTSLPENNAGAMVSFDVIILLVLVFVVILITAVLIRIFWKKK